MGYSLFFSCFTLTFLPSSRESVWSGPDFLHSFCAHSLLMDSHFILWQVCFTILSFIMCLYTSMGLCVPTGGDTVVDKCIKKTL